MKRAATVVLLLLLVVCVAACDTAATISSGVLSAPQSNSTNMDESVATTPVTTPLPASAPITAPTPTATATPVPTPTMVPADSMDGYRGIPWGATRADVLDVYGYDCVVREDGTIVYQLGMKYGDTPCVSYFYFTNGLLSYGVDRFYTHSSTAENILGSVVGSYGSPIEEDEFDSVWKDEDTGSSVYFVSGGDSDYPSVVVSSIVYCAPETSVEEVRQVAPTPTPTPAPTPEPTPTPAPTATPEPTPKPTPTPSPAPIPRTARYVLNKNTKKFHRPSCASAKQIKNSNRIDFEGTRDEVIAKGYVPCKRCYP